MSLQSLKMVHAALDDDPQGEIILRGVLDPQSLIALKVGEYQREIQPLSKINELIEAFRVGSVPDIDLGMRGGAYFERDNAFYLQDDVYVIDGLQRRTAAVEALKRGITPKLGAAVHFNTTEEYERRRFRMLNTTQLRVSPNVQLRNLRPDNEFVAMMYDLCQDKSFPLCGKVCWNQRMHRDELLTATVLLKTVGMLHVHFGAGLFTSAFEDLAANLLRLYVKQNKFAIRQNMKTFWIVLDSCWPLNTVHFKESAAYLRLNFLLAMAKLFGAHQTFWRNNTLIVSKDLQRKLSTFPVMDGEVIRLAGSTGLAREMLYDYMVRHINSGKRTCRLVPFKGRANVDTEENQEKE